MIKHFHLRFALLSALLLGSVAALSGCEANKGPAERAGERIDKAGQNVRDVVDPPSPTQKLGREVDRATGNSNK